MQWKKKNIVNVNAQFTVGYGVLICACFFSLAHSLFFSTRLVCVASIFHFVLIVTLMVCTVHFDLIVCIIIIEMEMATKIGVFMCFVVHYMRQYSRSWWSKIMKKTHILQRWHTPHHFHNVKPIWLEADLKTICSTIVVARRTLVARLVDCRISKWSHS